VNFELQRKIFQIQSTLVKQLNQFFLPVMNVKLLMIASLRNNCFQHFLVLSFLYAYVDSFLFHVFVIELAFTFLFAFLHSTVA
jgi:hypothetical protein